jgi:hypothetical protein
VSWTRGLLERLRTSSALVAAGLFLSALLFAIWWSAGSGGLLYLLVYALAVTPGLPLGFRLFGRQHPAGWVAGILFGYGLFQIALWAAIVSGAGSGLAFVALWALLSGAAWIVGRRPSALEPLAPLPSWSTRDTAALLLTLLLVPALMGPPYGNLGRPDSEGNRYYRAYFTADFLWHAALTHELGKFTVPPRNPYMASRPIHYYWTYFLLPAAVAETAPSPLGDVQTCLKTNAILTATAMLAALFVTVRTAARRASAAALAVTLCVVAASYEGTYTLIDFARRGIPYDLLRNTNIDAVAAWRWSGLRIDNVPRSMWYTPQHTLSVALGLIGVLVAITQGAGARRGSALGAGVALGLSTAMNPFLGAAFSVVYGAVVVADWFVRGGGAHVLARHLLAAAPVVLAVLWAAVSRMADGAGAALTVGFTGLARNRPVQTLLVSLGPVLLPSVAALVPTRGLPWRPICAGAAGVVTALALFYFVSISDAAWVGFRAGQIFLVSLPILLARVLDRLPGLPRAILVLLILVAGLPTTVIDAYNAQDIANRRQGPGFRWTLWTTPAQQEAFRWIRQHTAEDALVQMEPVVRGREHWTLIPSFAGRRMAAGLPISLLPQPQYAERSELVREMFETPDPRAAWTIARRFQIDYVYADTTDFAAYPDGIAKFDDGRHFERVFANAQTRVYRVR